MSKTAQGHLLRYLLPVEWPGGRAAARGGGLGSPCWEGFQLLQNPLFQLYTLSRLPCGAGPATWCSFQAWIAWHSEQGTVHLLRHFVCICYGGEVIPLPRTIPSTSRKVWSEGRWDKSCAGPWLGGGDTVVPGALDFTKGIVSFGMWQCPEEEAAEIHSSLNVHACLSSFLEVSPYSPNTFSNSHSTHLVPLL